MERELKLFVTSGAADALLESPVLKRYFASDVERTVLVSTYFDTPELAFRKCGASLRVRLDGDRRLQTIKFSGKVTAGLYEREEFECAVAGDAPELASLQQQIPDDSDCGALIRMTGLGERLVPVFVTRIHRARVSMRLPGDEDVELALDDGVIEAEGHSASVHGAEMELKSGHADSLYLLALELLDTVPVRIDRISKGDRGYELIGHAQIASVRAAPLKLGARDSVEDAFGHICENCFTHVQGNERGVTSGQDPACVHQMRVGLRRLRSALGLFQSVIPTPAGLQDELKWIAGELGGARDWEVMAGTTLPQALGPVTDTNDAIAVLDAAKELASQNRKRAAAAVDSERYTRLVLALTRWFETSAWRESLDDDQRQALTGKVRKYAGKVLSHRHALLLKRGKRLARLDDESRHRARIAAKKLRYATEFFSSLYSRQAVNHYLAALSQLQDDLGWRNDVVVGDALLKSLPLTHPETGPGASFARGYMASRTEADRDLLRRLWKRFKRLSPPN